MCSDFCLAHVLRSLLKCLLDHSTVSLLSDVLHSSNHYLKQYLYCPSLPLECKHHGGRDVVCINAQNSAWHLVGAL